MRIRQIKPRLTLIGDGKTGPKGRATHSGWAAAVEPPNKFKLFDFKRNRLICVHTYAVQPQKRLRPKNHAVERASYAVVVLYLHVATDKTHTKEKRSEVALDTIIINCYCYNELLQ